MTLKEGGRGATLPEVREALRGLAEAERRVRRSFGEEVVRELERRDTLRRNEALIRLLRRT